MRVTRRIAKKMAQGSTGKIGGGSGEGGGASSWAKPVVRIATAGVSLGMALIIISTAIVQGFQHEVRELVIGFSSHLQVIPNDPDNDGLVMDLDLLDTLSNMQGVRHVAPTHIRLGLIETAKSLKGVTIKGCDYSKSFSTDTTMLSEALLKGRLPHKTTELLISAPLARKLEIDTGDRISLYLVIQNEDIKPRPVRICGIYETGLLEFDERFVFVSSELLQEASGRGVQAVIYLEDGIPQGKSFGLNINGERPRGVWKPHLPSKAEESKVKSFYWIVGSGEVQDTARLFNLDGVWSTEAGDGTDGMFADGYEIFIDSYEDLARVEEDVFHVIPYSLTTKNVIRESPEIFSWLGMLDINVIIIIGLMVLISIINMVSALLIVILERRSQVGLLKALGMKDNAVIMLFIQYAARIIGVGFIMGNILGFGVCIAQTQTGFITLDPAAYYVSEVPILLDFSRLAIIEIIAFIACVFAMLLPAWYSTRILPSTALRIK